MAKRRRVTPLDSPVDESDKSQMRKTGDEYTLAVTKSINRQRWNRD